MVKDALRGAEVFVYVEDQVVRGFVGVADKPFIAGLFVDKPYRGGGIGSQLIAECKKHYPILSVHVFEKNHLAAELYKKNGFEIQESKEDPDTGENEYVMSWHASFLQ